MQNSNDETKVTMIVEHVFDLQSLTRGALRAGESLIDDPKFQGLGLDFMAVMSILSHLEARYVELIEKLDAA